MWYSQEKNIFLCGMFGDLKNSSNTRLAYLLKNFLKKQYISKSVFYRFARFLVCVSLPLLHSTLSEPVTKRLFELSLHADLPILKFII